MAMSSWFPLVHQRKSVIKNDDFVNHVYNKTVRPNRDDHICYIRRRSRGGANNTTEQ